MKIGVLSRNPGLYSTRRLVEVARKRGHTVLVIDTASVAVTVGEHRLSDRVRVVESLGRVNLPGLWTKYRGRVRTLPGVDGIIPRIGASITYYGLAVVRQFEAMGVVSTASSAGIASSRDKLQSLQVMAQAGLPIPKTAVISRPEALYPAMEAVGGPPVVVKLIQGTQGRGVILAVNFNTTAAVLAKLRSYNRQALVQEYVAEAKGRDIRVIVVGDQCVAAMERIAPAGDFRANLHRGGTAVPHQLDTQTQKLAIAAAQAHNLGVAGVDIIQSNRGPLILEVNSSPGLEGIETTTGINVAEHIIVYLETIYQQKSAAILTNDTRISS
ncbi:MAG: RimK family alpha-L-glutamate ligase [Chloroflexi bacterium]|nr:MAG: RimK family alpha-L-glutamate ligase [Chloroflexota bacterium]